MKLNFKPLEYQKKSVESVIDCFRGQPNTAGIQYRIDPGLVKKGQTQSAQFDGEGFKNAEIKLSADQILENIHDIQKSQNLPLSNDLNHCTDDKGKVKKNYSPGADINLDIEMETGTGKTYCYIKSIFELNKQYGWSKFIIMVPTIAIREGVHKSLEITADHFNQIYGKKIRSFVYNSKDLHKIESFSSDAGINVMVINIQAFAATGADNRKIYEELDDFQSRRPIDVISANRPILILDEPQKMEGPATQKSLPKFNPLFILRYSATHKTVHNKIHRLDALDAYNQKLVKRISVRGIKTNGLAGTNAYLYLEQIEISKKAPVARLEIEQKLKSGDIKRKVIKVSKGDRLYDLSGELAEYKDFVVSDINAVTDTVEFLNGKSIQVGVASNDITEDVMRRIQIRDTIKSHLDKERRLFGKGIKVLSLFFIDEVVKYRDYSQEDEKGEYARAFEEEYQLLREEYLTELSGDDPYKKYLAKIDGANTHEGYFAIDKKKKLVDPKIKTRGEERGLANDESATAAYDLILKKKEQLLSFEEDKRFIFSHSALREGWDNPNVFVICMLKHADYDNVVSRRQEVGRGLRISVNQHGERQDHPATVHETNVLTVVANESFGDFVKGLQSDISESLSARPKKADKAYFLNKVIKTEQGDVVVDEDMARAIERYLIKNDYVDDNDEITDLYHAELKNDELGKLPESLVPYGEQVIELINGVFSQAQIPEITDDRKPKSNVLNANFEKKAFQKLWNKINRKAVYQVNFDSDELVKKSIAAINEHLHVTPLQYTIEVGDQRDKLTEDQLKQGAGFEVRETDRQLHNAPIQSSVPYDLIGEIAEDTKLTRKTVCAVLQGIAAEKFDKFKVNPEQFISEATRLINEEKATATIQQLSYDLIDETYDTDIFTQNQVINDFSKVVENLKKHVYDFASTDSKVERKFIEELDTSNEIEVYAKLPKGFTIPTPLGTEGYNPDWAIAFKDGTVKHVLFIAETKGSMSTMQLKKIEEAKIECAKKFFKRLEQEVEVDDEAEKVKFNMVASYNDLLKVVGQK
ncbi:type III restriction-modification system endonuclease [Pseudoalteromonas sp. P1-8]|uniref:type III restriction-modification system endonuclease n=1 Tax=Pseudoalteromonas sp. P1-8 TaxID=1710353 RepID=UPI0006DC2412|nr:DEAD/DEAH box helicase family protein [Pseudoalteromonas sp. P1-8]KPW04791.1 Type III restriction enzyme, res subunit [Pseudoalteromonas sp. P1-8]